MKQIERAYFECASAHESEGLDIGPEFRSWLKEFRGRDGYFTAEWLKERPTDLPALAEVARIPDGFRVTAVPEPVPANETEPTKVEPFVPDAQLPPLSDRRGWDPL